MTLPQRATAQSGFGGRGYKKLGHPEAGVVPSVTTILKAEAKPALAQWAVNQTVAYLADNPDELLRRSPEKARDFGKYYWTREPDVFSPDFDSRNVHLGVLQDSAELGTLIHEWIQADTDPTCAWPDVSNVGALFWEAVAAWEAFKKEHDISVHYTENTVWNSELGYAGTFDGLWTIDGKHSLMDIKTGRGLYSSTWMQLAALYHAPELLIANDDGIDTIVTGWAEPVERITVLHVRPSDTNRGKYLAPFCKLVDMPGDPRLHMDSFEGLLKYTYAQKAINDAQKALDREAKTA